MISPNNPDQSQFGFMQFKPWFMIIKNSITGLKNILLYATRNTMKTIVIKNLGFIKCCFALLRKHANDLANNAVKWCSCGSFVAEAGCVIQPAKVQQAACINLQATEIVLLLSGEFSQPCENDQFTWASLPDRVLLVYGKRDFGKRREKYK